MKLAKKTLLLLSLTSLILTACDFEKRSFCLETYNHVEYVNGFCMQLSKKDINEVAYVFVLPNNPDAEDEKYEYDITWSGSLLAKYFTFVGGLDGKKIDSVTYVNPLGKNKTLRINLHGAVSDTDYTSGYLKISREAFKANVESAKDAFLYAYFKVGDYSGAVLKPSNFKF